MTRAKDISKIITDADFSGTLDVTGTVTAGSVAISDDNNYSFGDGTTYIQGSGAADRLKFITNASEAMRIDSSGNVGIGTSTPAHNVEIVTTNAGSVNDSLQIRNNATSTGTGSRIRFINSTDASSDANGASISSVRNGDDNDLVFETENSEAMRIDHSGNVGIGTTSPAPASGSDTTLEIAGSSGPSLTINDTGQTEKYSLLANADDLKIYYGSTPMVSFQNDGNVGIGTASPSEKLNLVGSSGTSKIRFDGDASNLQNNFIGITGYDDLVIASDEANSGTASTIQFRVDAVERVRIDSSGNVGIGESNPVAKTHIQGSGTSGQTTASLILENSSSGTAGMDITGSAGSSRLRFLYGGGPSTGTNTLTEAMNIVLEGSNAGNVGIGINPQADFHITDASDVRMLFTSDQTGNTSSDGTFLGLTDGGIFNIRNREATNTIFYTNNTERMRIDSSGNLLVGKTAATLIAGHGLLADGTLQARKEIASAGSASVGYISRGASNGNILTFYKDATSVGNIGVASGVVSYYIIDPRGSGVGITATTTAIYPCSALGAAADNVYDWGFSSARWDDIYATNGTIQTSDRNEKQDIEELSEAEQRVAVVAKGLMRKFRWKDKVAEKGDNARTHFGIIAQDLQDAFTAEGLDAGDYAMFCSNTWTDDDGNEQTRLGVRYNQLLAFIISAI